MIVEFNSAVRKYMQFLSLLEDEPKGAHDDFFCDLLTKAGKMQRNTSKYQQGLVIS